MTAKKTKKPATKKVAAKSAPVRERLDIYGIDKVIQGIKDCKSITAIAVAAKVSKGTLIAWIAADSDRSTRVREARADTAMLWDEKAEQVLDDSKDFLSLAKAREIASHYRWRASKIAPKIYGDKQQVEHSGSVDIGASILAARARSGK
jgi:hypothetical protein